MIVIPFTHGIESPRCEFHWPTNPSLLSFADSNSIRIDKLLTRRPYSHGNHQSHGLAPEPDTKQSDASKGKNKEPNQEPHSGLQTNEASRLDSGADDQ